MSNLAIIPARGGSKRIPRKNIKNFHGKPIIAYSIEAALSSNLFEEVIVSTEDPEIAEVAQKYGAKIPFLRSKENSDDYATIADVILEVIDSYENLNKSFDTVCCIFSTAPFISVNKIIEGFELMNAKAYDSVFTIQRHSYPIWRSLKITNDRLNLIWPENLNKRSQDLIETYHDAGQFYLAKTEAFKKEKTFMLNNCGGMEIGALEGLDIDTLEDWDIAEKLYRL